MANAGNENQQYLYHYLVLMLGILLPTNIKYVDASEKIGVYK